MFYEDSCSVCRWEECIHRWRQGVTEGCVVVSGTGTVVSGRVMAVTVTVMVCWSLLLAGDTHTHTHWGCGQVWRKKAERSRDSPQASLLPCFQPLLPRSVMRLDGKAGRQMGVWRRNGVWFCLFSVRCPETLKCRAEGAP